MREDLWRPRKEIESQQPQSSSSPPSSLLNDDRLPLKIRELANSRGLLDWESFQRWVQPRLSELRDPYLLLHMEKAIDRLVVSHERQEKIALYGDFDLDGTSALALLKAGFSALGFQNFILYQPSRLLEGYGFHVKAVDSLHESGVSLIITADVGITAVAAAKRCSELGVDLIVTDHHLPAAEKPSALALINPNQEECTSNLGHLSGVGVAFYLVWALRRKLVQLGRVQESALDLKDLLDCFVIGTLTDMVPLKEENRVLVKHGLLQLGKTKRPGIRLLLEELGLNNKDLTSQDVAIRFAPKLNALSRMELNLRPLDLFVVEDESEAQSLISQVMTQNDIRVTLQSEAEQLALEMAKTWSDKQFIFISHLSFHKGIVGLVATKLSQVYQKPAFVGAESPEGIVVGSARAPQNWKGNLVEALGHAALYMHRFGGHAQASGFEYALSQKQEIVNQMETYFEASQRTQDEGFLHYYDVGLQLEDIHPTLMSWVDLLGPFGQGFEVPIFKVSGVEIQSVKSLKGGHQRLELSSKGITQEALLFGPTDDQRSLLNTNSFIDVLVEMQWNYFRNRKRIQLLIKSLRPTMLGADLKGSVSSLSERSAFH